MQKPINQKTKNSGENFEAFLEFFKDHYTSRVNANDLLGLERGLFENLQKVRAALSTQYSANDQRTVREVLEDGK